ncbi:sucrase-isomaltase, intestinal isoform X2 [Brienomyrus brachyistius]|nr:sucrase-isomaltase, intestinal isoform X2 [Brienomyrus brachyistius]XP_048837848.1 sucrase-isomaltase, intestinal isoform X2 [Brienomyrus brachyistius]XP_048837849.1 sucrase-isomaltase, intestinal isoform X2 [Brienomyrus brachyistius]XP_048837851.1 sucrase-isomaltase, intestinal isoform X2 [Brienomyrus brachyistius]XP_048837852.1 sucrase-isomaltase, intestinal isoform X2 [Brienomyrus brachyistius]XP_048837853.1 sucrase-isomaltase, intestinal isoform X2 [Brienomyrus brachyistius]XP_04883785
MGKRKFSGLEVTLIVMFLLVAVVAIALVVVLATGEPAVITSEDEVPNFEPECPNIVLGERVDCFPESGASMYTCAQRGCCWQPLDDSNAPWCFFPANQGYEVTSEKKPDNYKRDTVLKRLAAPPMFPGHIEELVCHEEMQTPNRFRFKITDTKKQRFEVRHEHVKPPSSPPGGALKYEVELVRKPFGLKLRRADTKRILFDTTMGPLVFADQYLQLSARLPSHNIYGLGEHVHQSFRHDTNWKTWPIFTRDSFPNGGTHNLYGHYPFFLCLEDESGQSFGVFLMNSNAMEITLQPAPAVTYRTVGGVLDFYILLGNSPEAVVQEFLELIGRPMIPPYWSLGFQLSRWGYSSLDDVKQTVERNRAIGLPYDVQFTDIDYMEEKKDFTYDLVKFKDLPQFADYLHAAGQKYVLILDPAIAISPRVNGPYASYDRGNQKKVWVTEADGETPLEGEVWPGQTVFPDYTKPACKEWWTDEIQRFYQEVKHDALWIDMNEVSNFRKGSIKGCTVNTLNYPPFTPNILDKLMYSKTLCMDARQAWGSHYDVHSLYGYSMVLATDEAMKQVFKSNRSLVFTRSSFPGTGKFSGHWLGDNAATWNDLKWAITGMLEFNLFGIPYIGADICGFFDNTTEELCRRWMQVGAFYTFSRNHNAENYQPQDPAWFGADSLLVRSSKHYLNIRYTLLPFLYTLFYHAHITGDTVIRPVMHEFYSDNITWTVDRQFLWGSDLLITPVLDPGVETVRAYIPDAVWYDYDTEERFPFRKQHMDMILPADKLGLHIRGGAILPTQRPAVSTVYSRRNPMGLLIALDDGMQASGQLFWDDGDSRDTVESGAYIHYQFSLANDVLTMTVLRNGYTDPNNLKFEDITILGVTKSPGAVEVTHGETTNKVPAENVRYDAAKSVLYMKNLTLELGQNYTVKWSTLPLVERFDCHPDDSSNEENCKARGCIWEPTNTTRVPWCFYPADYGYAVLKVENITTGLRVDIQRDPKLQSRQPGSPDIDKLRVDINYLSGTMLQFKIYDPVTKRFEVPVPLDIPPTPEMDANKRLYEVSVAQQPFGIKVTRKSTGTVIWDSSLPGFTFSELFIQISTRLPSKYIYGFGETEHTSYLHDLNWNTWGMFSKDQPPGYKVNSYGVHPFYMGLENTSHAHGVLLLNSNAMDVTLQPTPALTYRTIGGILDFFMVFGPRPEMVVQQYTALIGRPVLPAYWSLGFQLCRYGYENTTEIENLYNEMRDARIPYDVQYADIDYMERQMDFTLSEDFKDLPALVDRMRKDGMRFIPILDPAIAGNETDYTSFTSGVKENVFIKWPDSDEIMWGKVWPDLPGVIVNESLDWDTQVEIYRAYTAFPDFFRSQTIEWWYREINDYYNNTLKFDGLWIDMNEPVSFVHGTVGGKCPGPAIYDNPPYMPALESKHMGLNHKTLCMNSMQYLPDGTPVKHYDVHSLYGWSQAKPTYDALLNITKKRGVVISRSTYPSSGKWVGHWLGDNTASWDQLYKSVIGMMEFSLFGISYTGADICGFFKEAEYEMCLRWMELGAFYPYSRNHNGKGNRRQDPVAWNSSFTNSSRRILTIRYTLLPYLYTLMFEAHSQGSTVIRPLLHEFVEERTTWSIDRQFLWGPALLITPVMDPGVTEVTGYIPDARWYDFYTAKYIEDRRKYVTLQAPNDHINLHVRGGYILPWQDAAMNTQLSRQNPLGLIVALDDNGSAEGSFFWDDGEGIDTYKEGKYLLTNFTASQKKLKNNIIHKDLADVDRLHLDTLRVWGAGTNPVTGVTVQRGEGLPEDLPNTSFSYDVDVQELKIDIKDRSIFVDENITITWRTGI